MYLKMVYDAELKRDVARIFCMGLQASTWSPTQMELFGVTDWEEYVGLKVDGCPFVMTEHDSHGGKPVTAVSDEEHQKQLLDTLINAFAELVSRRVAQLLK